MRIAAPLHSELRPALQWVEVASFFQIPGFQIIGLPAPEIAEARERVRAAIDAAGLEFPRRRVVVNLAPAGIRKRGTGADLAVALAILADANGDRIACRESRWVAWGELGLGGELKASGQLTRGLSAAWESADVFLLPRAELEAALEIHEWLQGTRKNAGPRVLAAATLREAWELLAAWEGSEGSGAPERSLPARDLPPGSSPIRAGSRELLPLRGSLERTVAVAASGRHHVLLLGPRGVGKSHAAEWLLALQAEAAADTLLERAWMEELTTGATASPARSAAPVRRVSSQARPASLTGGFAAPSDSIRPGEFSLAHGGILVADEFPEWHRDSRELLREPLERGLVTLSRARGVAELPARFQLVATGNLCPCGGWPSQLSLSGPDEPFTETNPCRCALARQEAYLERLSGPVLDRTDMVSLVSVAASEATSSDRLEALRARVEEARGRALRSWGKLAGNLEAWELEALLRGNESWAKSLRRVRVNGLRSRHKTLRVALTLAAWEAREAPTHAHFLEASLFRPERLGLFG